MPHGLGQLSHDEQAMTERQNNALFEFETVCFSPPRLPHVGPPHSSSHLTVKRKTVFPRQ
jgi:hypothetical protein